MQDRATDTENEPRAARRHALPVDWRGLKGAWFKDALTCPYPEITQPLFFSQFFSKMTSPLPGFSEATLQSSRSPQTLASCFPASDVLLSCVLEPVLVHALSTSLGFPTSKKSPSSLRSCLGGCPRLGFLIP